MAKNVTQSSKLFERTNNVMKTYYATKERVVRELYSLSDQAGDLVIEQVNYEMDSTRLKLIGRGVVLGCGVANMFLLGNSIGIAGNIIGYIFIGGSIIYEMKCKENAVKKITSIHEKLKAQLTDFIDSRENALKEMDKHGVFASGMDFKDNLEQFREIMLRAEKQSSYDFTPIEEFITKLKKMYNQLDESQKNTLNSKLFLDTMANLFSGEQKEKIADIGKSGKEENQVNHAEIARTLVDPGAASGPVAVAVAGTGSRATTSGTVAIAVSGTGSGAKSGAVSGTGSGATSGAVAGDVSGTGSVATSGTASGTEAVSGFSWATAIQGLNLVFNTYYIFADGYKLYELYNMKQTWQSGQPGDQDQILNHAKFEDQKKMKDLIRDITIAIMNDKF